MTDYAKYSFWLETCGEDLTPRPALRESAEVDVAILGAGYSGLWTAYYLLRANPNLRVAVLEREIVGFGASGRNGGWCSSRFPVTPSTLETRYGKEAARLLLLAMFGAVDEIGRVCEEEGIAADYHKGGILSVARGAHQWPVIQGSHAAYDRLGLAQHYRLLSKEEANERVAVSRVCGGLYTPQGARVHPGKLVRGLARAVERRGGVIYEKTAVTAIRTGPRTGLLTETGLLRAKHAVVLAGEAYLTRMREYRRYLLPMYSLISLTEPLTEAQWATIGWRDCDSLASCRLTVDYLTRTADSRILFGSRGAPYVFGSRISDEQDRHEPTHSLVHRLVVDWFPSLRGIGFTHDWGGPVGVPRDWMPTVSFDSEAKLAMISGYTGQGVGTSNLSGRILADLLCAKSSELTALPLAQRQSPSWEVEPLRWLAVRYMQQAFLQIDLALEAGQPKPWHSRMAEALGKH